MNKKVNILSTRVMEKNIILPLDFGRFNFIQQDFIHTQPIAFNQQKLLTNTNWIISSKTAFKIILDTYQIDELKNINFYCVGQQTAKLIADIKLRVVEWANYSENLAQKIVKKHSKKHFFFIGGEMRRGELPSFLENHNVSLKMINIYTTVLSPNEINEPIDGLIFFSPSAVQSYVKVNTISNQQLFCIGNTTAKEATKYSQNVHLPQEQTFKSVIDLVNNYYK